MAKTTVLFHLSNIDLRLVFFPEHFSENMSHENSPPQEYPVQDRDMKPPFIIEDGD